MHTVATAIIMRHARALEQKPGEHDFDRVLAPRGIEEAHAIGRWLYEHQPRLGSVISSPAARARMTGVAVLAAWGACAPAITWEPALYLAELPVLIETLEYASAAPSAGPTLLIGHNPGLEELLEHLLSDKNNVSSFDLSMPTAAVFILEVRREEATIRRGSGIIRARMCPARLRGK